MLFQAKGREKLSMEKRRRCGLSRLYELRLGNVLSDGRRTRGLTSWTWSRAQRHLIS